MYKFNGYLLIFLGIVYLALAFWLISMGVTGLSSILLGIASGMSFTFAMIYFRYNE